MINCARCGKETITEFVAGKQTKNCKPCRGIHSIKNKRKYTNMNQTPSKRKTQLLKTAKNYENQTSHSYLFIISFHRKCANQRFYFFDKKSR